MAVPTHFRITARGDFTGTPEQWSFGFHFKREQGTGPDAGLSDIDDAAVTAAFAAFFTAGAPSINNKVKMTDWRAYVIGTDGHMEGNPKVVDVSSVPIVGAAQLVYPPQIALVATLVADNRGPARFGRFFIPGPGVPIDTSWRLSEQVCIDTAEKVTQLLKGVSDAIDIPGGLESSAAVNVSTRGGVAGTLQDVDHVEVGRALDTLRSRRRSLVEERHIHGQIDW